MRVEEKATQSNPSDAPGVNYLEGASLRFTERGTTLHMTVGGKVSWLNVRLKSLLPLSSPGTYVSAYDSDGTELGIIKSLAHLDADSQCIASQWLQRSYFLPVMQRILRVKERFGILEWEVVTNLGRRSFVTRNTRETTVRLSGGRVLLCDVDGNSYEVREATTLDETSRAYLSRYL